jgi:DNA-binding transcriptional regulator LsrR (DeoR family)
MLPHELGTKYNGNFCLVVMPQFMMTCACRFLWLQQNTVQTFLTLLCSYDKSVFLYSIGKVENLTGAALFLCCDDALYNLRGYVLDSNVNE